ncbi:MAG: hypothetical protein JSU70_04505 [Phycisphaerales bacterium]|nr:MAG: hypothetical protein JSU70_04505 [Phycisphaerales bacterium]
MKAIANSAVVICLVALAGGCADLVRPPAVADYSDKAESEQMRRLAVKQMRLKLDNIQREGSEYNFLAVKSDDVLISRRLDSRTYFVQDQRYGPGKEADVFRGGDKELKKACYELLARLGVPASEVRDVDVLHETTQVASVDPKSGEVIREKPQRGCKFARCSRHIEGIPVFSSNLTLALTEKKTIGFMELHWPVIPQATIKEAHRLQYKLKHGWKPPEQKGVKVESADAGIIHSAAAGLLLDIYPAIRVVYAPQTEAIGRKLVLHFDRHGNPVPMPRDLHLPRQLPEKRRQKQ